MGIERAGKRASENHPVLPRRQILESPCLQVAGEARRLALLVRKHPAHRGAYGLHAVRQQPLRLYKGYGGLDSGLFESPSLDGRPVRQRLIQAGQCCVGGHAEDASSQLPLESIHDREDHQQRGDSQHQS